MTIRAKFFLLLGTVIVLFGGALFALELASRHKFFEMEEAQRLEREEAFDRFLAHWTEPLETFVADNSAMDRLVQAIGRNDNDWSEKALGENALAPYHAHAVWVYDPEGRLYARRNELYAPCTEMLPVPIGPAMSTLRRQKFCHFFTRTPIGLVEVRGATVNTALDADRAGEPRGYFFAGRLWGNEDLQEMALFTGNRMTIEPPGAPAGADAPGEVTMRRTLAGWDGRPVAEVVAHHEARVMTEFHQLSQGLLIGLVLFAGAIFLLIALALRRWVLRPFRAIAQSLQTENPALLNRWAREPGDYGPLARIIRTFFEQRLILVEEMRERRQAESSLREREEQLRHALRLEAIGRLAGGVAHDFNNLLTVIIGYSTLLPERSGNSARHAGEFILQAAEKAAGLTRQLLAFSRKQVLHPRVLDLNAHVQEMQRLLRRTLGSHVELRVRTEADPGRIRADPTQLEQVIVNLAINARDAMAEGGTLTIATEDVIVPAGDCAVGASLVSLSVTDTGCGMDRETQERIFEPFFTTKEAERGTGLGLATVHGIVLQSGGTITVESEPGSGTTFRICFPAEYAPVDPPEASLPPPEKTARHERVLVVEDDPVLRELTCKVLESYGFAVECKANGQEALALADASEAPFDVLVTDVLMPVMGGPALIRELRRRQPQLPVLVISGYWQEAAEERVGLGVVTLEKPFTPQALVRAVQALLEERTAGAERVAAGV